MEDDLHRQYTPNDLESSLNESVIVTPKPTTRGFGIIRSAFDLFWDQEENLYKDLENKKFDPDNSSYHRKLDATIEAFTTKKNSARLTATLALCRKEYNGQVKISDIPANMAHEFLVQENKNKQNALKNLLEAKDKQFIEKQNVLIATLQKTVNEQLANISQNFNNFLKDRNDVVEEECAGIRILKEALLNIHKLNKAFMLTQGAYCSDNEETNPDKVNTFYNDSHLLKKIKVDKSMNDTKIRTERTLAILAEINASLQNVQALQP